MKFFKKLDKVRRLYLVVLIAGVIAGLDGLLQFSGIGSPGILRLLANLAWPIMLIFGFFALVLQRKKKNMKKKKVSISSSFILLVLFSLILSTFICLSANKLQQRPFKSTELTSEAILEELKIELSKNFTILEVKDSNALIRRAWLRDDNYAVEIKNYKIIIVHRGVITGGWERIFELKKIRDINNIVEEFLTLRGYIKNNINSYSYEWPNSGEIFSTKGFENGPKKCLVTWGKRGIEVYKDRERHEALFMITCGLYDEQSDPLSEILPFFEPNRLYTLDKKVGNYVVGRAGVFPCCTGCIYFAVKENDQWKIVAEVQEPPSCEVVDKYKVPREIYIDCYESYEPERLRFSR